MKDYLYDGTFEGFLTCVYAHYYQDRAAGIYPETSYQLGLLHPAESVITDLEKADRVSQAVVDKICEAALQRVYCVFLSSEPQKEMMALNYLRLGFKKGPGVSLLHGNPIVYAAQQTERKVKGETHRLCGLIRFSVLAMGEVEILYSKITPDHDVTELLAPHFTDRYKNDPFIIHDSRRGKALFSQPSGWYIGALSEKELPRESADEPLYRALWKKYFETIAIRERVNPRCQKNFMPVRYWKNLTEFQGAGSELWR